MAEAQAMLARRATELFAQRRQNQECRDRSLRRGWQRCQAECRRPPKAAAKIQPVEDGEMSSGPACAERIRPRHASILCLAQNTSLLLSCNFLCAPLLH